MTQTTITLETARQLYKEASQHTKNWLLSQFPVEDLEQTGHTWESSFNGEGWYIDRDSNICHVGQGDPIAIKNTNHNIFRTEKQANSVLAFSQLSHIVAKYNEGKDHMMYLYIPSIIRGKLIIITDTAARHLLYFYSKADAEKSLEVNRALWEQFWMV